MPWAQAEPGSETIRFPLLLKISFGRHVPRERLADFTRSHRRIHATRLAQYEAQLAASQPEDGGIYREATLAFRLAYERAVMAWFDALPG
jgi:hypothetical protein